MCSKQRSGIYREEGRKFLCRKAFKKMFCQQLPNEAVIFLRWLNWDFDTIICGSIPTCLRPILNIRSSRSWPFTDNICCIQLLLNSVLNIGYAFVTKVVFDFFWELKHSRLRRWHDIFLSLLLWHRCQQNIFIIEIYYHIFICSALWWLSIKEESFCRPWISFFSAAIGIWSGVSPEVCNWVT